MRNGGYVEKLIVPVYLNQKLVFDLLAMLQDGISTVKAINTTSGDSSSQNEKLSVGFGLSEAFSTLLKIDLSGSQDKSKSDTNSLETNEEKVHTPASLFFKLRNLLIEKNIYRNCQKPAMSKRVTLLSLRVLYLVTLSLKQSIAWLK